MRKMIAAAVLTIWTVLFSLGLAQGIEVYSQSGQVYSASQYKIFETTMVISLKDGRQQKLPLDEIDWSKTLGDRDVFQLVETNQVYTRNGKTIKSKGYIVRHDETVEVITRDNEILKYDKSSIDFGKIADHLLKKRIKQIDGMGEEQQVITVADTSPLANETEEIYCNDIILLSSSGNPLVKFKFDVSTLKDAKFSNLSLKFVTIEAAAKNLSDAHHGLSYDNFALITSEGAEVQPDSSLNNTFSIGQLAKNAMTFGTIRFSFTASTSTEFAKYLVYRGFYGRFKCRLE